MSLFFDARCARIYVCYGAWIVDTITLGEFKQQFGVEAVRALIHGEAFTR